MESNDRRLEVPYREEGFCFDRIWGRYYATYATAKYSKEALRRILSW